MMKTFLRNFALLLILPLFTTSCTVVPTTPTHISATKFPTKDYDHRAVAVLPIVVNPAYSESPLPLAELQAAIADQLKYIPLNDGFIPSALERSSLEYPLTPKQILKFLESHSIPKPSDDTSNDASANAAIGISVLEWSAKTAVRPASIVFLICFADKENPERAWTMVKEWVAPTGDVDQVPIAIAHSQSYEFMDLGRFLRSGRHRFPMMPENHTDNSVSNGFLAVSTLDVPPGVAVSTSLQFIDLSIVAGVESGIRKVEISNDVSSVPTEIFRKSSDATVAAPQFYNGTPSVYLHPGNNTLLISVLPDSGPPPITQAMNVLRESSKLPTISVLAMPGYQASDPDFAPSHSAISEIERATVPASTESLLLYPSTKFVSTPIEEPAKANLLVRQLKDRAGPSDLAILYLAGRVEIFENGLYLVNEKADVPSKYVYIDGLRIEKIARSFEALAGSPYLIGVGEFCANDATLSDAQRSLEASLPRNWVASVSSCDAAPANFPLAKMLASAIGDGPKNWESNNGAKWILDRLMSDEHAIFGAVSSSAH